MSAKYALLPKTDIFAPIACKFWEFLSKLGVVSERSLEIDEKLTSLSDAFLSVSSATMWLHSEAHSR